MHAPSGCSSARGGNGGEFAGLSGSAPDKKPPVVFNGALLSVADRYFAASLQVRIYRAKIPAPTVDYYVFSLGRILI